MIVLDASVAFEVIGRTEIGRRATAQIRSQTLHAPHLLDVEFVSILRRQVRLRGVTEAQASAALEDLRDIRLIRHPHFPFLHRVWEFRQNFSAYDATYLALADHLAATLLTRDAALATARLVRGRVVAL